MCQRREWAHVRMCMYASPAARVCHMYATYGHAQACDASLSLHHRVCHSRGVSRCGILDRGALRRRHRGRRTLARTTNVGGWGLRGDDGRVHGQRRGEGAGQARCDGAGQLHGRPHHLDGSREGGGTRRGHGRRHGHAGRHRRRAHRVGCGHAAHGWGAAVTRRAQVDVLLGAVLHRTSRPCTVVGEAQGRLGSLWHVVGRVLAVVLNGLRAEMDRDRSRRAFAQAGNGRRRNEVVACECIVVVVSRNGHVH